MTNNAGVAQRPERLAPVQEVAGENPAPRSILQAFAKGFAVDEAARSRGLDDALNGRPLRCPDDMDLFSYALGHTAGTHQSRGQQA